MKLQRPMRYAVIGVTALVCTSALADFTATPTEARAIAKEAYLYGFPIVEMYKTMYTQAVDGSGPNFKAPFNQIGNTAMVFTPKDTAFVTPNSDTPYSFAWLDLRAEPVVLTLPPVESNRYYSVQLIDLYTQNFDYLGTRTTGNKGGNFLIAGPNWKGQPPAKIDRVVHSESDIAYALYRTQLFSTEDLAAVKKIQQGYLVTPLSQFEEGSSAKAAPPIQWPRPEPQMSETSDLFRYLNFMLAFAPPEASERDLLKRFSTIGIEPGRDFDPDALKAEQRQALEAGIADGKAEFADFKKTQVDTHKVSSGDLFGDRQHLKNNYLYRYAGANMGIFGNSADEAAYLGYFVDNQGTPVDASKHNYTLHFNKGALPPANAFWSLTMYDGATKLLVDNPLDRYLINSRMLPQLKPDVDGGLTLYVQNASPGKDKESNWLPAPKGPFYGVLRIYLPKPEVGNGQWKLPLLTPVDL